MGYSGCGACQKGISLDLVKKLVGTQRALMAWLWASLICNMGIVVTGGIVRLTGSGLGCSDWPYCTPDRLTPHPELGIHGLIEFGNRTLTGVLCFVALGAWIAAWWVRGRGTKLWWVTFAVGWGIVAQAIIGGITVKVGLNPFIVGFHLTASIPLIVLCTWGVLLGREAVPAATSTGTRALIVGTFCAAMVSVVTGTLTTGAGPHAGDVNAPRNGLNIEQIARIHALSAWVVAILAVACVVVCKRAANREATRLATMFLAAVALQGAIGYLQYFLGIPASVVWMHMAGLTVFAAASAWLLFGTKAARFAAV